MIDMNGQRQPLREVYQPVTGHKGRKTYGKKDRNYGRVTKDREIFLAADENFEKAFQDLTLDENAVLTVNPLERKDSITDCGRLQNVRKPQLECSNEDQVSNTKEEREPSLTDAEELSTPLCYTNNQHLSAAELKELEDIFQLSDHKDVQPFDEYARKIAEVYNIEKIGEGAYSSVFLLTKQQDDARPDLPSGRTIIKMIPLHLRSQPLNDETTKVPYVANEIKTLKLMDQVHGFVRYRSVVIVQGRWPTSFLDAFRVYKRRHPKRAENSDPEGLFAENQCYALIEMQDAGNELDTYITRPSAFQMYDIFWMTTIYLAMAEELVEFEHRDLHSSNICIKPAKTEEIADVKKEFVADMQQNPGQKLGLTKMTITIIDYTLSRATSNPLDANHACRSFESLNTEAESLEKEKYEDWLQQSTYEKASRCINSAYADLDSPDRSKWSTFVPKTNVCWLSYLLAILLNRCGKQQKTKYVKGSNKVAKKVQDEMINSLKEVEALVMEEDLESLPGSASELLSLAVSRSWLTKEEVDIFKVKLEADQG